MKMVEAANTHKPKMHKNSYYFSKIGCIRKLVLSSLV